MKIKSLLKLTFAIALMGSPFAFASDCGLPRSMDSEDIKPFGKSVDIQNSDDLNSLQKQQIVLMAKALFADEDGSPIIRSASEVIKYLKKESESGDLDVSHFKYDSKKFTFFRYYPGGNPYGVVFEYGTRKVVALVMDDSIACQ